MSECQYYQELISRMLDKDLSKRERAAVMEHLDSCSECAAMYEAFSMLSNNVSANLVEPPEELTEDIMANIRRSEMIRKNRKTSRQLKTIIASAACVAVIVAVVGGFSIIKNLRSKNVVYEPKLSQSNISVDPASGSTLTDDLTESAVAGTNTETASQNALPPIEFGQTVVSSSATTQPGQTVLPTFPPTPVPTQNTWYGNNSQQNVQVQQPVYTPVPTSNVVVLQPVATPTQSDITVITVPTPVPTPEPTPVPTPEPTPVPTPEPTPVPTPEPTPVPTPEPTPVPTPEPVYVAPEVPVQEEPSAYVEPEQPVYVEPEQPVGNPTEQQPVEEMPVVVSDPVQEEPVVESKEPVRIDLTDRDTDKFIATLLGTGIDTVSVPIEQAELPAEAEFSDADFSGAEFAEGEFTDTGFTGGDFAGAELAAGEPSSEEWDEILPDEEIEPDRTDIISYKSGDTNRELEVRLYGDDVYLISDNDDGSKTCIMAEYNSEAYKTAVYEFANGNVDVALQALTKQN